MLKKMYIFAPNLCKVYGTGYKETILAVYDCLHTDGAFCLPRKRHQ